MFRIANHHVSLITSILLLIEFSIALASVYLGAMIRALDSAFPFSEKFENFFGTALVLASIVIFSMSALGMYQINFREGIRNTFLRLMPSLALALILITLTFYVLPSLFLGRGVLGIVLVITAIGILTARALIFKTSESGLLRSRIIFLGSGSLAKECYELALTNTAHHEYEILGFVSVKDEICQVPATHLLSSELSLSSVAEKYHADEIVVAVQNRRGAQFPIDDLLDCKLNGVKVIDASAFFEREACQIRVESLQPGWLVFGDGFNQSFLRRFGKQIFDLTVSAIIFLLSSPIMLVTAMLIYIEDRGPIFYKQERVGKNGKTYMVLKFRSMGINAEKAGSPQWAANNDPRTTRVGKVIRNLRIDELPQILNVLSGEMSFVGPRPERPFFVDQLCKEVPFYNMRHSIKPGITGMAQVRYAYGASVEDSVQKLQYDLYYVKNNSLFLDALILLETVQVVLLGKGAR
ncbi:TIGR03013 family PEP-CTERM/XrtA system glycosyltransferase [Undibacterium sp. Jales W-56]|uniref:TIGR03013 family XrtA/PEP-CTERM system glycosyltransferase n=1 Tax=Undibacterium sp. Jales W-56 TaxID=2897325 RepID=UPI0021D3CB93|nr:TIGR03013 family XrtA/PEP-CTERM system glycosyltransferase [Undibacterium sp. Jales W-56]MCU6434142.1 TIGR03013 family PEP-CTERM/XrtA system glycosyltransferase [Undibacterium sp. Jales W-56]